MIASNLRQTATTAESIVINQIRDHADASGLILKSVKPESSKKHQQFDEISVNLNANGDMDAMARFLYAIETNSLPLALKGMRITSANTDGNDLSLQTKISFIYQDRKEAKSGGDS